MKNFRMPSTGTILAFIALAVAMSGVAYAAKQIGAKGIKNNAVKSSKIKDGAVITSKLANGAVTADKIAPGVIGGASLPDALTANHGQVALPSSTDTVALQTSLPQGNFVVSISGVVGNSGGAVNSIDCTLLDANNPLALSQTATTSSNTFQASISLTGVSDGGVVRLSCNPDLNAQIKEMKLTAIKVGTVTPLPSTP